jgi:two-component system, chemotaxis family, chemotaxis protein CheY
LDYSLDLRRVSVVVLDDIPNMRRLLGEVLRGLGCGRVYECATTDAALQLVISRRADIVLADVALNGEDGLAFVRQVRALGDPELAATPIVMISAHSTRTRVEAACRAGATCFLAKPITIQGIADHLTRAVAASIPQHSDAPSAVAGAPAADLFLL